MKSQLTSACLAHAVSRGAALAACLAVFAGSAVPAVACNGRPGHGPEPLFSAIYVFGDSWSDTCRAAAVVGEEEPLGFVWYDGRLCNGPMWIEYVAPALGLKYDPLDNYAFAGAMTGQGNLFDGVGQNEEGGLPGMLDELEEFLGTIDPAVGVDPDALYVVFGGSNDMWKISSGIAPPDVVAGDMISNTVTIVGTLRALGAEYVIVVDIPDWGLAPIFAADAEATTAVCLAINSARRDVLAACGLDVIHVSVFDLMNRIAAHPRCYGFTNVTETSFPDFDLARRSLFWDDIHLTSRANAWIALAMLEAIDEADLARPGRRFGNYGHPAFACGMLRK